MKTTDIVASLMTVSRTAQDQKQGFEHIVSKGLSLISVSFFCLVVNRTDKGAHQKVCLCGDLCGKYGSKSKRDRLTCE